MISWLHTFIASTPGEWAADAATAASWRPARTVQCARSTAFHPHISFCIYYILFHAIECTPTWFIICNELIYDFQDLYAFRQVTVNDAVHGDGGQLVSRLSAHLQPPTGCADTWHLSTVKMFVWCALTVRRSPCSWLQYNFDQFSCIACLACHTWMHYALLSSCTLQAKCTANASVVAIHSPTLCWRFCGLHFTHLCRIAVCVRVSNPLCPGPLHFIEGKCIKPFIKTTHMHGHVSQFVQPKYVSMWHIILANAHLPRILWRMAEQLSG